MQIVQLGEMSMSSPNPPVSKLNLFSTDIVLCGNNDNVVLKLIYIVIIKTFISDEKISKQEKELEDANDLIAAARRKGMYIIFTSLKQ